VTVDVTVYTADGFHGDCSRTFLVGDKCDKSSR
jgi:methionine aminopeptidase